MKKKKKIIHVAAAEEIIIKGKESAQIDNPQLIPIKPADPIGYTTPVAPLESKKMNDEKEKEPSKAQPKRNEKDRELLEYLGSDEYQKLSEYYPER